MGSTDSMNASSKPARRHVVGGGVGREGPPQRPRSGSSPAGRGSCAPAGPAAVCRRRVACRDGGAPPSPVRLRERHRGKGSTPLPDAAASAGRPRAHVRAQFLKRI